MKTKYVISRTTATCPNCLWVGSVTYFTSDLSLCKMCKKKEQTMNVDKLLSEYMTTKELFDQYKKKEAELRIELLSALFPNGAGTEKATVNNIEVKGKFGVNYKLSAIELDEIYPLLSEKEQECIIHKPSLVMKMYNSLEEEERSQLDECITTSPAMPSISIKEIEE